MKSRHGLSKSPKELTGKRYLINVRHEGHLDVSSCNSKQNFTKQEMRLEREGLGKPAVYHSNSITDTSKGRVRQNPQRKLQWGRAARLSLGADRTAVNTISEGPPS